MPFIWCLMMKCKSMFLDTFLFNLLHFYLYHFGTYMYLQTMLFNYLQMFYNIFLYISCSYFFSILSFYTKYYRDMTYCFNASIHYSFIISECDSKYILYAFYENTSPLLFWLSLFNKKQYFVSLTFICYHIKYN